MVFTMLVNNITLNISQTPLKHHKHLKDLSAGGAHHSNQTTRSNTHRTHTGQIKCWVTSLSDQYSVLQLMLPSQSVSIRTKD